MYKCHAFRVLRRRYMCAPIQLVHNLGGGGGEDWYSSRFLFFSWYYLCSDTAMHIMTVANLVRHPTG